MEYILTTKSNIDKPLLKLLSINMKEQHCNVKAVRFLGE